MPVSKNIRGNNVSKVDRIRSLKYSIDLLYGGKNLIKEISKKHDFNPTKFKDVLGRVVGLSDRVNDLFLFRYHRGLDMNNLTEAGKYKHFWLEHIKNASVHWQVEDEINDYIKDNYKPSDFTNDVDPYSLDKLPDDRRAL